MTCDSPQELELEQSKTENDRLKNHLDQETKEGVTEDLFFKCTHGEFQSYDLDSSIIMISSVVCDLRRS